MKQNLTDIASKVRFDIVDMVYKAKDGHPGPSLSSVDLLVCLYFECMNIDPADPENPDRDRFILSKGHGCPALYATLAERGYFPLAWLPTLRSFGSHLQGHPSITTVGVDMVTGSLGNGLPIGSGMAIAGMRTGRDYYTYVITGDGELNEGVAWEGVIVAAQHKLDNLIVFVDNNGHQSGGHCSDVSGIEPIADKFAAFGWHVQEIDGHNHQEILQAVKTAKATTGKPSVIVARTIKGKGISYMEGNNAWHKAVPTREQWLQAAAELGGEANEL